MQGSFSALMSLFSRSAFNPRHSYEFVKLSTMKWISAISALFFGLSAYWQFNDPDAIYWGCIYAAIGVYSLINLVFSPGEDFILIPLIIAAIALIWGLFILPDFNLIVDGEVLNIFVKEKQGEEEREVLGLLLVFLFAVFEMFHTYSNSTSSDQQSGLTF